MIEELLERDFLEICSEYNFDELNNSSVLVTGATGLIGSQVLLFLDFLNRKKDLNIKLIALCRNKQKALSIFNKQISDNGIIFVYGDILSLPPIDLQVDYIIHGASITSSKEFISNAVETIDIAINGTLNLLRFASKKKIKSFLYLSSMEAFGITDGEREVKEKDLGYIDISSPRSSYSESKRMCENLCVCFNSEYNVPVKIIRLTQTLGVGFDYNDTRVAAEFARSVIEKKDIILKTPGLTKRPILYTADAISAILIVLLKGNNGEIYTAANPETFVSIRDTAEMIAKNVANGKIKVVFDIKEIPAEYASNIKLQLKLNIDKLHSLGWNPKINLQTSYERMIEGMRF